MTFTPKKPTPIDDSNPDKLGSSVKDLVFYIEDELDAIAAALNDQDNSTFPPLAVEPTKPRQGLVVYADGTNWNPGNGEGLYYYGSDAAWHSTNPASFGSARAAFAADKNGSDQTFGAATLTKITMTNEVFDVGGFYDAANSKWTPPAGKIRIDATLWLSSSGAMTEGEIRIRKNGSDLRAIFVNPTVSSLVLSMEDVANGTDFYEMFASGNVGATITAHGATLWTYWSGTLL
jgi:hypothetical protein